MPFRQQACLWYRLINQNLLLNCNQNAKLLKKTQNLNRIAVLKPQPKPDYGNTHPQSKPNCILHSQLKFTMQHTNNPNPTIATPTTKTQLLYFSVKTNYCSTPRNQTLPEYYTQNPNPTMSLHPEPKPHNCALVTIQTQVLYCTQNLKPMPFLHPNPKHIPAP